MQKVTVKGVLKSCPRGGYTWAGYISAEQVVPESVKTSDVEVIDPEDSTGVWVLAHPSALQLLNGTDLDTIASGETARAAKAKLTDEELAALGLTRD